MGFINRKREGYQLLRQRIGAGHQLKVQVRHIRLPAVAHLGDWLQPTHKIPRFDAQGAPPSMGQEGIDAGRFKRFDHQMIPCEFPDVSRSTGDQTCQSAPLSGGPPRCPHKAPELHQVALGELGTTIHGRHDPPMEGAEDRLPPAMVLFMGNSCQQFSPRGTGRGLEVFVQAHEVKRKFMPGFGTVGANVPLAGQRKANAQRGWHCVAHRSAQGTIAGGRRPLVNALLAQRSAGAWAIAPLGGGQQDGQ